MRIFSQISVYFIHLYSTLKSFWYFMSLYLLCSCELFYLIFQGSVIILKIPEFFTDSSHKCCHGCTNMLVLAWWLNILMNISCFSKMKNLNNEKEGIPNLNHILFLRKLLLLLNKVSKAGFWFGNICSCISNFPHKTFHIISFQRSTQYWHMFFSLHLCAQFT